MPTTATKPPVRASRIDDVRVAGNRWRHAAARRARLNSEMAFTPLYHPRRNRLAEVAARACRSAVAREAAFDRAATKLAESDSTLAIRLMYETARTVKAATDRAYVRALNRPEVLQEA